MMLDTIKNQKLAKVAIFVFFLLTVGWILLRLTVDSGNNDQNQIFAAVYGIMALLGGLWGSQVASMWGGWKSIMGRAILMFSYGLLAQEFGQLAYTYYIYFLKIDVPYPSVGDIGYFGSILFYSYGVLLLARAAGVTISLKSASSKLQAIVIPIGMLALSYYFFLQDYEFDLAYPMTIFLDFGYPFGQAIYISLAILTYLLSRKVLGGVMRSKILFILFALVIQYMADYTFLYQASRGSWYAGGFNDYMYLLAYFFMTLGILQMKTVLTKLRHTEKI